MSSKSCLKGKEGGPMADETTPGAEPEPRQGTLAWLKQQPHADVQGLRLPTCHRIPDGATILLGDDDGRCRVERTSDDRCKAPRLRDYGVCLVHAGGGGMVDPAGMQAKAVAVKLARRERRELLGIGPRRTASARQIARIQAMDRAQALATAIVSA